MEKSRPPETPGRSKVYVFGSANDEVSPSDIDVLVIYDRADCDSSSAFDYHLNFFKALESCLTLPLDITLLTEREEQSVRFIDYVGAIPIDCAWPHLVSSYYRRRFE